MAGKKHRNKTKTQSRPTKSRREEELRALFNGHDAHGAQASSSESGFSGSVTKTILDLTPTPTPTPTATIPSAVTDRKRARNPEAATESRTIDLQAAAQRKAQSRGQDRERDRQVAWWFGPLLILATILLFGFGWFHVQRPKGINHRSGTLGIAAQKSDGDKDSSVKQQVEYYKRQLGQRLNRDRIAVEIDNQLAAPQLRGGEAIVSHKPHINGVPLMPEGYQPKSSRDRTEPVSIDHPDARIQYSLQEEQDRDEFQKKADKAYIKEFIDNARDEGFEVKLDSNLNVISVEPYHGARRPSNQGPPTTSR